MEIIRIPVIMQETSKNYAIHDKSTGFVPTMGALHEGHLSLMKRAKSENDIAIVSIFVNPAQFGPEEDFDEYPRDIEGDIRKLKNLGIDVLFLPDASLIYPEGFTTFIEVKELPDKLCGPYRPGHFKGVTTIVAKLLNMVRPKRAYFGEKDFQQGVIIGRMVHDLNMDVEIIICPTIREKDGLAMSSRNLYLNPAERADAVLLYKSMKIVEEEIKNGKTTLKDVPERLKTLLRKGKWVTELQYASIYDPESLDEITGRLIDDYRNRSMLLAIAIKIGEIRLIDNLVVEL